MREQNEHIFNLLQKSLKEKGEDYLLKEGDVVAFYKKRQVSISERTARDILKRLYPSLDPKTRKERFFARRIISKFILHDLGGTSLEDLLNPHNLELIEKELNKRNISFDPQTLEDLIKSEFTQTASRWSKSDVALQVQSAQDKMVDVISQMLKEKTTTFFENDKPKLYFKDHLAEAGYKLNTLSESLKGLSTYTKALGYREYTKKIMSYEADVQIDKRRKELAQEDKEYLDHQISEMINTANPWFKELWNFTGRTFVVKGGRGGGKSYEIAKFLIIKSLQDKNIIFLCVRQTRNVISDSSLSVLKRIIATFNLQRFFDITTHTLRDNLTASYFIFKGTKNPENTLKSLENVKYVWVDEAQLIPQEFWTILNPTIRRDDSMIILSLNPKTEEDPVHTTYIKEEIRKPTTKVISVNFDVLPALKGGDSRG